MNATTRPGALQTGTGRADSTHVAHATTPDDAPGPDLHDWLFGVPASETGEQPAATDADSQPTDLDADPLLRDHEDGDVFPAAGGVVDAVAQDARVWARRGARSRPTDLRRLGLRSTAALVGVGALLVASPAAGYWLASTATTGTVTSQTLAAPSSLTAVATATTLTISVTAPSGGPTPTGYTVTPAGSTAQSCTMTGSSSGPVATCVVSALASGTSYTLAVRSTLGSWVSGSSTSLTTSTAAAPAPARPVLTSGSDSGTSQTDGITNVTTPTLTGAATVGLGGAEITVLDGSVGVASATAAADGSWTATVSTPLSEGSHLLTAVAALNSGARGTAGAATTVRVDTTAPGNPAAASGTCGRGAATSDANGWYCRDATFSAASGLQLSFAATDAVGVGAYRYAATTSTTSMPTTTPDPASGTSISAAAPTPRLLAAAGYARLGVAAVDLAGNVSGIGTVLATVDTTPPTNGTATTACVGTPLNGWCRGSVLVTLAGITDAGVTSLASAADWAVTGGTSGSAALAPGGGGASGSFQFNAPDGSPAYTVSTRDTAGNASATTTYTSSVKLDNTAPTATSVALSKTADGSVGKGDSITLTFADATSGVDPKSVYSGWANGTASVNTNNLFTVTIADTGTNDTMTFSTASGTLSLGSVRLGANYVTGTSLTFSGNGSNATALSWSNGAVTVTLGQLGGTALPVTGTPTLTWTPPTTVTDLAGNTISTTSVTGTGTF